MSMLEIEGLETHYEAGSHTVEAVNDVNLELDPGETLGLVGESGSGKSTIAKSLLKLLPRNGKVVDGTITYNGEKISNYSEKEFRDKIRWDEIAIIPQSAMNGFDPVYTIGDQIVQAIQTHEPQASKKEARSRAHDLFERLGLEGERINEYPHQFSGGMAQRAMIALSISCDPSVLIADEPTTALDVVLQDRILDTIKDIQAELKTAMIIISHDMSVVSERCDRIAVCYGGRIVEQGPAETIINDPNHPYTMGLRNAFPDIEKDEQELISIPGTPPQLINPSNGCRFTPRCPFEVEDCSSITPSSELVDKTHVECHRADEADELQKRARKKSTWHDITENHEK